MKGIKIDPMTTHHARKPGLSLTVLVLWLCTASALAVELKKKTTDAYDAYLVALEQQIDREQASPDFFWGSIASQEDKLRAGEVFIQKAKVENQSGKVPDGLVHHWSGFIFIPDAGISRLFTFLQDYDHHQDFYKPEVSRSKLLQREGDHFVAYMRFVKKKVITVVLDTEHDVHYTRVDAQRAYSRSHTTH